MLEGLLGGHAGFGVVDEDSTKEVKELLVEFCVGRDDVLCGSEQLATASRS